MAEHELSGIAVNSRTIDIGGETLTIAEIVRMKAFEYHDVRGYGIGARMVVYVSLAATLFGLLMLALSGRSSVGTLLAVLGPLVAIATVVYSLTGPTRRILAIELSSGGASVLTSHDFAPLLTLKSEIAKIIEEPPSQPQLLRTWNIYSIDLRNASGVQVGSGNRQLNSTS